MSLRKNTYNKDRACFHVAVAIWTLAFVGLIISVIFSVSSYQNAFLEAKAYQRDRAQEVQDRIQNFLSVATQLSDTLRVFIERDAGGDRARIETYLDFMLESAPRELIYGTGAWWEPFAFDEKTQLFGPYVHWDGHEKKRILTYEWSREDYYFPGRSWYKSGLAQEKRPYLSEPYSDNGVTYITLATPFRNLSTGQKRGVITVDMILPQLQDIVAHANSKYAEDIAIVGRAGQILAHPRPQELLELARQQHPMKAIASILDITFAESVKTEADRIVYTAAMPEVGWTVIVSSRPEIILRNYLNLRQVVTVGTGLYLLILFAGYFIIRALLRSLTQQKQAFLYAEKMASLGEMAGGIAHEINNPLAIIQGATEKILIRLKHEDLNREDLSSTASVIQKTAERIARIIRSLRFVARDASLDPFIDSSIRAIVDETLALSEARLRYEDVQLEVKPIATDLRCVCRSVQISQVLINLMNNAMDAVRYQSVKWIRIEAYAQDASLQIAVTDSGPGIPSELVDRIMKPFFTTKEVGKGTGLGLSISQGIAAAHGGDLILDRSSTHTRFVLILPLARETRQIA